MASGICYTQSGGEKKYDGIVVPDVAKGDESYNPGYDNIKHDTSSVPGEDHYSFDDPSSYTLVEKGSSARDDCPLIIVTYYPVAPANPCYFNYKKKNVSIITIRLYVIGYKDYIGNVVFNCNVSSDNSEIATSVLSNNTIILYYRVVTGSGPVGSYSVRMKYGDNLLSPGIRYAEDKTYYIDMAHQPYCSPSSGTYNGVNWEIECHSTT